MGVESSGNEDERDDRQLTFGEKLRASKDNGEDTKSEEEDAKIVLTEQDGKLFKRSACLYLTLYVIHQY